MKVYEAHNTHAYQYAARRYNSHARITLSVLALNYLWLLPIAAIVTLGYLDGLIGLIIAYIPLAIIAMQLNAGKVNAREA